MLDVAHFVVAFQALSRRLQPTLYEDYIGAHETNLRSTPLAKGKSIPGEAAQEVKVCDLEVTPSKQYEIAVVIYNRPQSPA